MISDEYKKLFHYTTWDGLLGILQTQSIWATHYKFLNDYSELYLVKEKLLEYISPTIEELISKLISENTDLKDLVNDKGGLKHVVKHETSVYVDAAYGATGEELYICSFCGEDKDAYINENGLLSQWRGYGHGGGVALVFNTREMEKILSIESERYSYNLGLVADAIYSDDETKFKNELSVNLDAISEHFKKMLQNLVRNIHEPPDASKTYPSFIQCISRYKHRGFREENEIRVVFLPTNIDSEYQNLADENNVTLKPEKERKFRSGKGKLIPYIELFDSDDITLPIEKIIVGPHSDKDLRAAYLKVLLRKMDIKITVSEIPFVE